MSSNKQKSVKPLKAPKPEKTDKRQFPVVGIGASAGGLEALELFFMNMPLNNGMAFVVIQHLDPNRVGMMPELLQRITPMKVYQATDNLKVNPDRVYVIPPNKSLSLLHGVLYLFDPVETRGIRLPIDIFFRSLALDKKDKSIAIILSGMGSDGCQGLKAIKENNGIVLVQSPGTAKFDTMPLSAIHTVIADVVAPAEELPAKLIEFLKFAPVVQPDAEISIQNRGCIDKMIILIREKTGHDFSFYKKNTLYRRIERRMGIHQFDKMSGYVRFCQENPMEVELLFKELLIGVTSFFRDKEVWDKLTDEVLPAMIAEIPNDTVLRAWVSACSTGEEAYSLAICFKEALEKVENKKNISLQIFATDLDADGISIARKGFYTSSIEGDVSQERLSRFFIQEAEGYRIGTAIREMVVFAPQNLMKDPPFTRIDILTCRNLLIYLESAFQKKLITLFNYSLNPNGLLILGAAENCSRQGEGFKVIDLRLKIYTRTYAPRISELHDFPVSVDFRKVESTGNHQKTKTVENIQALADQLLLQRFAPASVLVNEKGDIIYITGHLGKYLEPVAGKANWNIYAMARPGLRNELPGALRKANQNYDEVMLKSVQLETSENTIYADVTLQRINSQNSLKDLIVILFTVVTTKIKQKLNRDITNKGATGRLKMVEIELLRRNEDLQNLLEEMQISQEELKSTNEELQSTIEEMQSANEQLTTSKEEMQSINEELQMVNMELQSKVFQFTQANDDMKNMLNSTEIATLFLDRELKIRRFTDHITNLCKLRKTDIGRPFSDLACDLQDFNIDMHAKQVLATLQCFEKEVTNKEGKWFNVRILPYRTIDDHFDGLVITFTDITLSKKTQLALSISEIRYHRLFESANDGILILDSETGKIVEVNPSLIVLLGYSREQFIEKTIWQIGFLKDIVANQEKFLELQKKELVRYKNLPLETVDGRWINVEFVSNVYWVSGMKVIQCFIREVF